VQTAAAPISYVESLFDEYAVNFDQSLQVDLNYEMPIILKNTMLEVQKNSSFGAVLDMGCGTGLTGTALRDFCDSIAGVDVSKGMLEQAKKKQVYDNLTHANITQYLDHTPLDFDYFVANDVFNYMGDLKNVFRLIASRNRRKTKIGFSTEHQSEEGFYLHMSGRYSHSKAYIQSLCDEYGYAMIHFSVVNLRRENGKFLTGALYIVEWYA
jgi:predicted TPR repeat methyltransferase